MKIKGKVEYRPERREIYVPGVGVPKDKGETISKEYERVGRIKAADWMNEGFSRIDAIVDITALLQAKLPIRHDEAADLSIAIIDRLVVLFSKLTADVRGLAVFFTSPHAARKRIAKFLEDAGVAINASDSSDYDYVADYVVKFLVGHTPEQAIEGEPHIY